MHLLLDWQHAHATHLERYTILTGHQLYELLVHRILQSVAIDAQDLIAALRDSERERDRRREKVSHVPRSTGCCPVATRRVTSPYVIALVPHLRAIPSTAPRRRAPRARQRIQCHVLYRHAPQTQSWRCARVPRADDADVDAPVAPDVGDCWRAWRTRRRLLSLLAS